MRAKGNLQNLKMQPFGIISWLVRYCYVEKRIS